MELYHPTKFKLINLFLDKSLDMVKRYLAIAQSDVVRDHAKASPVKGWDL